MNWYLTGLLTFLLLSNLAILYILFNILATFSEFRLFLSNIPEISAQFAKQVGDHVKTAIMGTISGISRGIDAVNKDLNTAVLENEAPPVLGLLELVPSLKKKLIKNPLLAQLAINALKHKPSITTPANGSSDYAKQLEKYK